MRDFRDVVAWQRSKALVTSVYSITSRYPTEERFCLAQQTRSAAISIPANIAEGCGRYGSRELARFVTIAIGSLLELESHLEMAKAIGLASPESIDSILEECSHVRRLLVAMHRSLKYRDS